MKCQCQYPFHNPAGTTELGGGRGEGGGGRGEGGGGEELGGWGALAPQFFRKNKDLLREESFSAPPPVFHIVLRI